MVKIKKRKKKSIRRQQQMPISVSAERKAAPEKEYSSKEIEKERWNEDEIKKAAKIFLHAEKNKGSLVKILDELVHWMIILIIIFGNLIISIAIVFLSKFTSMPYFYSIIVIFAICFGFLVEIPLRDIEKIDKNKHFLSRLLLPLLALANIYIIIGLKNSIEYFSKIEFNFNPVVAGIVYGGVFLVPHYLMWGLSRKK